MFSRSALLVITPHLSLSLPFARALYDRAGEAEGDLSFKKDDILYVDESLPKGSFGTWMAWQLDENAQQIQRGQIPSKYMWVENARFKLVDGWNSCDYGLRHTAAVWKSHLMFCAYMLKSFCVCGVGWTKSFTADTV